MLANLKTGISKTKQFVKDHPTLTACAITAAISWKMSHNATLKAVLSETTPMSYNWGKYAGQLELSNLTHTEFLESKGLMDEFTDFYFRANRS